MKRHTHQHTLKTHASTHVKDTRINLKRHTHQHAQGERAIFIVEPEYAYGDQIVWKGSLCPKLLCASLLCASLLCGSMCASLLCASRVLHLAFLAPLLQTRCCCIFG